MEGFSTVATECNTRPTQPQAVPAEQVGETPDLGT